MFLPLFWNLNDPCTKFSPFVRLLLQDGCRRKRKASRECFLIQCYVRVLFVPCRSITLDNQLVVLATSAADAGRYHVEAVNEMTGENATSPVVYLSISGEKSLLCFNSSMCELINMEFIQQVSQLLGWWTNPACKSHKEILKNAHYWLWIRISRLFEKLRIHDHYLIWFHLLWPCLEINWALSVEQIQFAKI